MSHRSEEKSFQQSEIETSYKLVKEDLENPQQGETMKQCFLTRQSRYQPQVKLWEYDLPEKDNIQEFKPRALFLNSLTEEYCELPQFYPYLWGGMWFPSLLTFLCSFAPFSLFYMLLLDGNFLKWLPGIIMFFLGWLLLMSLAYYMFKVYLLHPREIPIRLNRKRKKVYVYQYNKKYNPYAKWTTTVKVHDWQDVYGVITARVGRYDQGYRLTCVVCKPGTKEVIDEFVLVGTIGNIKQLSETWNFCCRYILGMKVPETPYFTGNPTTSEDPARLAKLIKWPLEIDIESRTTPPPKRRRNEKQYLQQEAQPQPED
ncbi:DUF6708 domain-containing protein [Thorsellia anophelis]|uniref:DUF6708 domain-containing protein n=1 Tax=Thorsellia anophelis DSM 18579 TaxID=1123402 RepID=A0A1I0FIC6_9GAMM|nr:DUF6708 domain-containing protein [Thorsellia anophelis]SET57197.1 hypothetical protein SAMN02583745_02755 [Thorsellia anophelis DSM 18579]